MQVAKMRFCKLFKNLFKKDNNILLTGTVGLSLSMNYLNDLICFIFVILDVIFKLPNWLNVTSWSKFTYFKFKCFLFVYLIDKFVVQVIAVLTDVKRMYIFFVFVCF
jgi:hypothetical protein